MVFYGVLKEIFTKQSPVGFLLALLVTGHSDNNSQMVGACSAVACPHPSSPPVSRAMLNWQDKVFRSIRSWKNYSIIVVVAQKVFLVTVKHYFC